MKIGSKHIGEYPSSRKRRQENDAKREAAAAAPPAPLKGLTDSDFEAALVDDMARFYDDPYGFVMYAFEWGVGELEDSDGPDIWQAEQLKRIGAFLKKNPEGNYREAIASGHGIGKTCEVAWLVIWAMSTRPHLSGVVTANTMVQLNTKTWREIALWWKRAINRHWFKWSATKFWHVDHAETWYVTAEPNTEHNSQAFAGRHARYKIIVFDEASTIPGKIYEVTEGAMTDPRSIWVIYGNPTENTGKFKDCFDKSTRWVTRNIDSRTCKRTDKKELDEQIRENGGEDSDFVRVRIRGMFPRAGSLQFIPTDLVDKAMLSELPYEAYCYSPVVIGVDVARYGDDKSVIAIRQGRKLHELRKHRGMDTMSLAVQVILAIKEFKAAICFVDGVGVGGGVVDRLRMLGYEVVEVNAGETARDEDHYVNKRVEMWDGYREWLKWGADLPMDPELRAESIAVHYFYDDKERMQLERKKDTKKRVPEVGSPDDAEAIALTFAEPLGDMRHNSFEPTDEFEPSQQEVA